MRGNGSRLELGRGLEPGLRFRVRGNGTRLELGLGSKMGVRYPGCHLHIAALPGCLGLGFRIGGKVPWVPRLRVQDWG